MWIILYVINNLNRQFVIKYKYIYNEKINYRGA